MVHFQLIVHFHTGVHTQLSSMRQLINVNTCWEYCINIYRHYQILEYKGWAIHIVNYVYFWLFYFHYLFLLKKENLTNALYIKYSCVFVKTYSTFESLCCSMFNVGSMGQGSWGGRVVSGFDFSMQKQYRAVWESRYKCVVLTIF